MNKEDLEDVIRYTYSNLGVRYGNAIVSLQQELKQKNKIIEEIETLVNRYSTNEYYYKYDNKYLKSEIIKDLLEIIEKGSEDNE